MFSIDMSAFSVFDIIVLISVLLSAVFGYIRGMVRQLIGLVGIIAGTYLACKLASMLADWWRSHFNVDEKVTKIVVFIISALAIYFLAFRLAKILDKLLKTAMLNWLNRFLGMIFGILKTVVIFCIVSYSIYSLKITGIDVLKEDLKKSETYGKFIDTANFVFPYMVKFLQDTNLIKNT